MLKTNKKRYILLASVSIFLHIFGVLFVLYSLIFNFDNWIYHMSYNRSILGLDNYNHNPYIILNIWMIAIQIRYIITDTFVFYYSLQNHRLLEYTIKIHGVESIICSFVFLSHNSKDCFIFGIICIFWSFLWSFSLYFIKKK